MTKDELLKMALEALEDILSARSRGFGTDYVEGYAQTTLRILRPALERQKWVHLLPDEKADIRNSVDYSQFMSAEEYATKVQDATEAKLKELNYD